MMNIEECQKFASDIVQKSFQSTFKIRVSCEKWDGNPKTKAARGFFTAEPIGTSEIEEEPVIVLLPERIQGGKEELEELLKHEYMHAFDHCIMKRDLSKCEELACSEIRAAREAECVGSEVSTLISSYCKIFGNDNHICEDAKKNCVERIAIRSTRSIFPDTAEKCVKAAFETCFYDDRGKASKG